MNSSFVTHQTQNIRPQRISVKTTSVSDHFWFAIFSVILYFADDNTLYNYCGSLIEAEPSIEMQCSSMISWFKAYSVKINPEKCHVIVIGDTNIREDSTIQIDNVHRAPESEVTPH